MKQIGLITICSDNPKTKDFIVNELKEHAYDFIKEKENAIFYFVRDTLPFAMKGHVSFDGYLENVISMIQNEKNESIIITRINDIPYGNYSQESIDFLIKYFKQID